VALTTGSRIGPYEIRSPLGEGGMGVVFRALDTKLHREVALKLLPDHFVDDPEHLARFRREAQVLASLNHPNIAQIHGLEDSTPQTCIVMELVEGETLQERLKRGPIPIPEALRIAAEIASAVEAAHQRGIIHRDLKPANIKVKREGNVKVLDFGLAKSYQNGQSSTVSSSPTVLSASVPGVIMGTAAYMSPEQAAGRGADRTTDVWAFGCVLYEMLVGRPAFDGGTVSEILAAVLKSEPDWDRLSAATPQTIRRLLRRCLQKDRQFRQRDIGDVRLEIIEASHVESDTEKASQRRGQGPAWALGLAVVLLILLMARLALKQTSTTVVPSSEMRFEIVTPPTTDPESLAVSPDGQKIVFAATAEGRQRLWLHWLESGSAQPLAGTDSGYYPFWSPDSGSLGFFADGKLKRIDIATGSVQVLASATAGRGGAWNRDGVILFAPQAGPIFRISAAGGEPTLLTQPERGISHRFPHFLPDGRHFLYYEYGPQTRTLFVGQLEGSDTHRLLNVDVAGVYSSPDKLVFIRQGTLFAQYFDAVRLALSGKPFPIGEQVMANMGIGSAAVSASDTGLLVYRSGPQQRRQFTWFDRLGHETGRVGSPDSAEPKAPALSSDGRNIAFDRTLDGNRDVWLLEMARGVLRRLTFNPALDEGAIWSPEGSSIVFTSNRGGSGQLYQLAASGAGDEKLLVRSGSYPGDWSPDGRYLIYRTQDVKTKYDIWALPMEGDGKPFPVVQTNFDERDAQFSPDGRWIAYESDESGRFEIYIQPFPGPGAKVPISTSGGAQVRWPRQSKELFYIGLDERLMSVSIHLPSKGESLEVGKPIALFKANVGGAVNVQRQQYVVSPDGQRFLINTVLEEATTPRITVILNLKSKS
jgi:serine/threonine protein kinase/Tol biopolymer transport system component